MPYLHQIAICCCCGLRIEPCKGRVADFYVGRAEMFATPPTPKVKGGRERYNRSKTRPKVIKKRSFVGEHNTGAVSE